MASNDPKTQLSNNNLIIIMILVSVLVIGVSGIAVNALWKSIQLDGKVITKKSVADKQVKADVAAAPNLIESYKALGPQGAILEDAMPTTVDYPSLLVTFENMSKDTGLVLKDVTPSSVLGANTTPAPASTSGSATPTPQSASYAVTLKGSGTNSYEALKSMLDHVEKSARPMTINGVTIAGSSSGISAVISLDTYYMDASALPFSMETVQ
jgi:hypothetical protein